jgi:hypothetical protein
MMSPTPSVSGTRSESQLIQHTRCINEGILIFSAYPLPGLQVLPGLQIEGLLKSNLPLVGWRAGVQSQSGEGDWNSCLATVYSLQ